MGWERNKMKEVLVQVKTKPGAKKAFCAGFVVFGEQVIKTAPILWWMHKYSLRESIQYCKEQGWEIYKVC